jgi:hypothetical protein
VVDDSSDLHEQLQALETDLEMYPDERLDLLLESREYTASSETTIALSGSGAI